MSETYIPGYRLAPELEAYESSRRLARGDFDINGNSTDAAISEARKEEHEAAMLREAEDSPVAKSVTFGGRTLRGGLGAAVGAGITVLVEGLAAQAGQSIVQSRILEYLPPEFFNAAGDLMTQAQLTATLLTDQLDSNFLSSAANLYFNGLNTLTQGAQGLGVALGGYWGAFGEDPISRKLGIKFSLPLVRAKSFVLSRIPRSVTP